MLSSLNTPLRTDLDKYTDDKLMSKALDQHAKADAGKPNPVLLEQGCAKALAVVQSTLDYGAIKYEAHSWKTVKNGMARYDAAARRHRNLRDRGETHDLESWIHHLGHEIICNLFLLELMIGCDPGGQWMKFNPDPPQGHKEGYNLDED